jgi:hypothetical protein
VLDDWQASLPEPPAIWPCHATRRDAHGRVDRARTTRSATAAGSANPDGDSLPAWRDLDSDDDGFADGPDDGLGDIDDDGRADFLDRDSNSVPEAPPPPIDDEPAGCFGSAASPSAEAPLLAFAGLLLLLRRRRAA